MLMKYRIYIDETGNSDLNSSDNPNHRYLSLTGVILELGYIDKVLHPALEQFKKRYFDSHVDDPVVFHRKELMGKKSPFSSLENPAIEAQFNNELLKLLQLWEYTLVTVLIDKKTHKEMYKTWNYDPYHYCMAVMLERYCFFLEEKDAVGDVMFESRGGKEDRRLKDSFHRLYNEGTQFVNASCFQKVFTSGQLKVKPKANNISGLQLADILAHPSRRQILIYSGVEQPEERVFGDKIIEILQGKYYSRNGKIRGYGIKTLP